MWPFRSKPAMQVGSTITVNTYIGVINQSTVVSNAQVTDWTLAIARQVHDDFAPIWSIDAMFTFFANPKSVPASYWQVIILDDADQAGALGYHELTASGLPLGKVFVKTTLEDKGIPSITMSHEVLEMLVDPYINLTASDATLNTISKLYAYEVADPCEDDSLGYAGIRNVMLSDFVLPEWFEPEAKRPFYDFKGHLTAPLTLSPQGYMSVYDISGGTGWNQVVGAEVKHKNAYNPPMGTRRWRRAHRAEWKRSKL